jgi:hypothetical protein
VRFSARSLLAALADAFPAFVDVPVSVGGAFWRRLLIALGDASPAFARGRMAAAAEQAPLVERSTRRDRPVPPAPLPSGWPSSLDWQHALRLPRFDRSAARTAGTAQVRRQRQETVIGNVRYVQRDAGRDRLEIIVEAPGIGDLPLVLPVTVISPGRAEDYLLMFRAEEPGRLVAVAYVPGIRNWAEVLVHAARDPALLGSADSDVAARSVRAAPDLWIPEWQRVAISRPAGDPVRQAIEGALRA